MQSAAAKCLFFYFVFFGQAKKMKETKLKPKKFIDYKKS
jgi:hypothetical protein